MIKIVSRCVTVFLTLLCVICCRTILADVGSSIQAQAIALQSDGKIVIAGSVIIGGKDNILLARYTSSGALDNAFGTAGVVTTAIGNEAHAHALAIQSDGKIVIAGVSDSTFALVRYTTSGSLDTSFDSDGVVTAAIGTWACVQAVAIQSDGKIVIAGAAVVSGQLQVCLVRYTTAGAIDTTFGSLGVVATLVNARTQIRGMVIQSDGKIIVTGWASNNQEQFVVIRYNSDGELDTSFSGDGMLTTSIGGLFDQAHDVVVQSDGKIIIAGVAQITTSTDKLNEFALARYTTAGLLDTTFDTDGKVTTAIGSKAAGQSVVLQSDGKIVVAGYSDDKFALARYLSDGTLDTSFNTTGTLKVSIGNISRAYDLVIQSDGKIIVAGWAGNDVVLMRFNTDGTIDITFGDNGLVSEPAGSSPASGATTVLLDEKPSGTEGGSFYKGSWQTRDLNKIIGNRGQVSLSNNQFTLQPGVYTISSKAPAHRVKKHQIRLQNITDGTTLACGSTEYADRKSDGMSYSSLFTVATLTNAKVFEVQHQCGKSNEEEGFGDAAGFVDSVEIYTRVIIQRI